MGAPGALQAPHTYADNGLFTVTVTVTSNVAESDSGSFGVTVFNAAPIVTPPPDQTARSRRLTAIQLGSFTDPGADSPWTVVVNWGDGSAPDVFQVFATGSLGTRPHVFRRVGTFTVTVAVTDKDGASGAAVFAVRVLPGGGVLRRPLFVGDGACRRPRGRG